MKARCYLNIPLVIVFVKVMIVPTSEAPIEMKE